MGSASHYWRLIRIDATGQRKVEDLAIAKAFFRQQFPQWVETTEVPDGDIQRELLQRVRQATGEPGYEAAALCLRCYISQEIEQECIRLERKFGDRHGITRRDLFPFVLDDDGRQPFGQSSAQSYIPLSFEVLRTFDPNQSKLNSWTVRLLKSRRSLNGFLRECGVYLESDWSILNQTKREQLQRILADFHALTPAEIAKAQALLQAYHTVYRHDRLLKRQQGTLKGKEKCAPPTVDQLSRIGQYLREQAQWTLANEAIMNYLQAIATQIRQYRLSAPPLQSLDQFDSPLDVAAPQLDQAETEQQEFLSFYREQLLICLDQALEQVTNDRLTYLQRKKPQNVELYLQALRLFHCQGQSMGAIARSLGLRAQDTVTRLLELKNLRASVRQQLLILLCDRILDKAQIYATASRLQSLNHQLEAVLEEQITVVMQQAENEATVARNQPLSSLFARRLCHYLDLKRIEGVA
ncbi:MAG: hypothetical protein Kow00121_44530 [Elainellaceae cyanobacterium]